MITHKNKYLPYLVILIFSPTLHASFIEATIGTAVVNDATAIYNNPAALTVLKGTQLVALGSLASFHSNFTGQFKRRTSPVTLSGSAQNQTHYYLPSVYLGIPISEKWVAGFAVISNFFNRELDDNSILRYAQSGNSVKNVDLVPGVGVKINDFLSVGANVSFSQAKFILQPVSGFPGMNVPDSLSRNESSANSFGGDVGLLLKPSESTLIGLNYRSATTYHQQGKSVLNGNPSITSNNYHFKFWTPARSVASINQFVTPKLGFISTIQYIQWSIFQNVTIYNIATQIGSQSLIIPKATAPYYFRDTWLLTVGSHYRIRPPCIVRIAATYNPTPASGQYQISNGDSTILGGSIGYDLNQHITIDASYAHAFINAATIQISSNLNQINGINKAERDSISLKLTIKSM